MTDRLSGGEDPSPTALAELFARAREADRAARET